MDNQPKILIVEDNRENLITICSVIFSMQEKYTILSAPDGAMGYEIICRHCPDLVLLDYDLPKMNGLEVLKKMKENKDTRAIPVIMFTSTRSEDVLEKAFLYGVVDFMNKPFTKLECTARIRSTMNLSLSYNKIKKQNLIISKQNRGIEQSIRYAKRIQESILPSLKINHPFIKDSFISFIPKDIISGDFYWLSSDNSVRNLSKEEQLESCTIVCGDCTGHGVPGSLMTMLGSSYLNELAGVQNIESPMVLLEKLDFLFKNNLRQVNQLKQEKEFIPDGMDISVCTIKDKKLLFSAAHQALIYFYGETYHVIKGQRCAIGGADTHKMKKFTEHTIDVSKGDPIFYLFSDGYQDQFGGKYKRRLSFRTILEMLTDMQKKNLSMEEQKKHLEKKFYQWIEEGGEKQIDDVLFIGFQINSQALT